MHLTVIMDIKKAGNLSGKIPLRSLLQCVILIHSMFLIHYLKYKNPFYRIHRDGNKGEQIYETDNSKRDLQKQRTVS